MVTQFQHTLESLYFVVGLVSSDGVGCCAFCLHMSIVAWSLEEIKSYIP